MITCSRRRRVAEQVEPVGEGDHDGLAVERVLRREAVQQAGPADPDLTAELAILVTTVYLHRGLTHRALTMHPVAAFPLRVVLWITTGIRPREWAGVHRHHHAALDTVGDPHSPAVRGTSRVLLTNILMYRNAAKNPALVDRYTHDMPRTRPAAKSGTNGQVLALLTAGEGLHNNHHAVPTAARLSFIPDSSIPRGGSSAGSNACTSSRCAIGVGFWPRADPARR